MENYFKTRCKDITPVQTVRSIRSILERLGLPVEECWMYQVEGYYSLKLQIFGTTYFSNGKGSTPEYALASAYGELMERLQNLHLDNMKLDAGDDVLKYGGFHFVPDEKNQSIDEILNCDDSWVRVFEFNAKTQKEKLQILRKWLIEFNSGKPKDFISIPFINLCTGKLEYLPQIMLCGLYGSNGMCAGNTPEEALVQGFSEVFERHAFIEIFKNRVTPPTIPDSYIKQYPAVYEMKKRIEQQGNFKVIVKDCSLGEGLPVVAIIFIDVDRHAYSIKFGAHPMFEIALERCLTELLQGVDFNNMFWVRKFSYFNKETNSFANYRGVITSGMGCFDSALFSMEASYPFKGFQSLSLYDNKHMMRYLYGLLREKGYSVLIRDVSFLGFPSYMVIVPFYSEITDLTPRTIDILATETRAGRTARNLKHATDRELQELIDFILHDDNVSFTPQDSLVKALKLPLADTFPWNSMKRDLLAASAYYKIGRLNDAYNAMETFVHCFETDKKDPRISYFKCVRDYFGIRADGIDDESHISRLLCIFYAENIVSKVISDLRNPNEIFRYCERLECFRCEECEWSRYCMYPNMKKIHMKLKDRYAENVIDQRKIIEIFQSDGGLIGVT